LQLINRIIEKFQWKKPPEVSWSALSFPFRSKQGWLRIDHAGADHTQSSFEGRVMREPLVEIACHWICLFLCQWQCI